MAEVFTIICSLIGGGAMGAIITQIAAKCRDKENERRTLARERRGRKHHFLGCLYRWRCQFQRTAGNGLRDYYHGVACDIRYEHGIVARDYTDHVTLEALVSKLTSFTRADIEADPDAGRQKLLDAINTLIQLVESTD